jgi:hypothetical protein
MSLRNRRGAWAVLAGLATAAAAVLAAGPASAAAPIDDATPLAIPGGPSTATVDPALHDARGQVTVSLRLADAPLAEAVGAGAKQHGSKLSRDQQRRYTADLRPRQADLMRSVTALSDQLTWLPNLRGQVTQVNPETGTALIRLTVGSPGNQLRVTQGDGVLVVTDPQTGDVIVIDTSLLRIGGVRAADAGAVEVLLTNGEL